ncbi:hypothetical protein FACS189456_6200 [Bacteroidia bacterium]|nr:hypothetical protein FACS189456_6200 [Bacteroidia bacterium]
MATYLTKIKGFLYKNPLTEDPNDYIARVESQRSLDVAQVCASATSRGGADIGASAMEHAVELFLAEMEYQLCNGFSVNAKTFTAAPHIKGVFNSPYETFDPAKHRLLCEFSQGLQLRQKLTATEVVIEGVRESNFHVDHIKDMFTNNTDGSVTRGKVTELRGHNIKIAGDDATCGIWMKNTLNDVEFLIDMGDIVLNEPSRILVQLPNLVPDAPHRLSIITQYNHGAPLEHPRTAVLEIPVVEVEQTAS